MTPLDTYLAQVAERAEDLRLQAAICLELEQKGKAATMLKGAEYLESSHRIIAEMRGALEQLSNWELHFGVSAGLVGEAHKTISENISAPAREALARADDIAAEEG